MNSLYHEFSIGFNWYYLVGPALLLLVFAIGWAIPCIRRNKRGEFGVDVRANKKFGAVIVAPVFAVVFGCLLYAESYAGIVQKFDNSLGRYESGIYSLIGAGMAVALVTLFAWALLYSAYCLGRYAKIGKLCVKYRLHRVVFGQNSPKLNVVVTDNRLPARTGLRGATDCGSFSMRQ